MSRVARRCRNSFNGCNQCKQDRHRGNRSQLERAVLPLEAEACYAPKTPWYSPGDVATIAVAAGAEVERPDDRRVDRASATVSSVTSAQNAGLSRAGVADEHYGSWVAGCCLLCRLSELITICLNMSPFSEWYREGSLVTRLLQSELINPALGAAYFSPSRCADRGWFGTGDYSNGSSLPEEVEYFGLLLRRRLPKFLRAGIRGRILAIAPPVLVAAARVRIVGAAAPTRRRYEAHRHRPKCIQRLVLRSQPRCLPA